MLPDLVHETIYYGRIHYAMCLKPPIHYVFFGRCGRIGGGGQVYLVAS